MKLILLSDSERESHTIELRSWRTRLAALAVLAAVLACGAFAAVWLQGGDEQAHPYLQVLLVAKTLQFASVARNRGGRLTLRSYIALWSGKRSQSR